MDGMRKPPMFIGEKEHTVDEKGRVFVPAKYREDLGTKVVVCKDIMDDCLAIYPQESFYNIASQIYEMQLSDERTYVLEQMVGMADDPNMDKQGRIMLSQNLRNEVGIERNVVVVGMMDHLVVWDAEKRKEHKKNITTERTKQFIQNQGIKLSYHGRS